MKYGYLVPGTRKVGIIRGLRMIKDIQLRVPGTGTGNGTGTVEVNEKIVFPRYPYRVPSTATQ